MRRLMTGSARHVILLLAAACLCVDASSASGAEVTMTGNVLPPAALPNGGTGISPSGSGTTTDPYVYTFATTNGLDMAGWKIYGNNQNNKNVTLNLNGGSITDTQSTNAFDFTTLLGVDAYSAHLTITNVGNIKIGKVLTYVLYNYGHNGNQAAYAGNVIIGANAAGQRAGKVEIAEINTTAAYAYTTMNSGTVSINATGDVSIWDGATRGNIYANIYSGDGGGNAGTVTIRHQGAFQASNVFTYATGNGPNAAPILLNGDILGTGPSGTCWVSALSAGQTRNAGQNVTVQGYTDITVADGIYTSSSTVDWYGPSGGVIAASNVTGNVLIGSGGLNSYTGAGGEGGVGGNISIATINGSITVNGPIDSHAGGRKAGNVTLSAYGDITANGAINLNTTTAADKGALSLATTANSLITLANLDLSKMKYAVVAPGWKCVVKGDLVGFSTNVATQTQLRMPAGKKMIYYPDLTNNAYLAGGKYALASVDGTPAAGGVLMPYASPGTVVTFK